MRSRVDRWGGGRDALDNFLNRVVPAEQRGAKPFSPDVVQFITSGPVVAMVLEGPGAVAAVRAMMGATNPLDSAPGTMRGDYALDLGRNVVHGSDSPTSAAREIAIFFADGELTG